MVRWVNTFEDAPITILGDDMPNHGAEEGLPLTPLAQWMRETTGIQGYDEYLDNIVVVHRTTKPTVRVEPPRIPHYVDIPELEPETVEFDPGKLYQAAREAIESFINERSPTTEELLEHERRIWALYDKIMGDNNGTRSD